MQEPTKESLLTTKEAAAMLGCVPHTLYMSRSTGKLYGVKTPPYIKRGFRVFYRKSTLEKFNAQFTEQANTAS